ncbi:cytochrome d ubiquinol oxidase subunit II [Pseudomonas fluorescens]|uniref:Cytochrome d ubiquinol oxidase subunit II n=1 Tax=Pseudomonas fluorescens TaxID=294 RepID=A0A1T2Y2D3_PSEFL|nr:cytochrome d ubiquinol oxidase subunit II [Pseudomonas fluorescens]OPA86287.1 cytochrome d ubiquinol oxidase subunit II [Pseudomonas fluorescens]
MELQGIDLSVVWAVIIAFGVMMYVVMDGFVLGMGILSPLVRSEQERDVMMRTVAPVWDGNETWLVLCGAALYGAFPLAYSIILQALYLPLILMLCGLIFRGVAFEFRFIASPQKRHLWGAAFVAGSLLATFCQGLVIGTYVAGIHVCNGEFAGGPLDWLAPFPIFCGFGLIVAYALLGSTWLVIKSEGALEGLARQFCPPLAALLVAIVVVICIATPMLHPEIANRWFDHSHQVIFALLVLVALGALTGLMRGLRRRHTYAPFFCTLLLMLVGFVSLASTLWPAIVPPHVTLWDAASPPQSQRFILVGTLFILPLILLYTGWGYYVFRGKVSHEGYEQ